MNKLRSIFSGKFVREKLFGKYLLATNTLTGGVMMLSGDGIQQKIERYRGKSEEYDTKRGKNMFTIGLIFAPTIHFVYKYMDKYLPGNDIATVIKKIIVDQLVTSPITILTFFCGVNLLEGNSKEQIWAELKRKFLFVYMMDCLIFIPCQSINFLFVPPRYRVLYVNTTLLGYDILLSYVKYSSN